MRRTAPASPGSRRPSSQALAAADRPFADLRISKRWVITLYPTPAMAAFEGIALDEYVRFVVGASTTDPRPLRDAEERLAPRFREGRTAIVVTEAPDGRELTLALDIGPCLPALSYGLRNVPDGEIYTSPVASATEGEIFLDLPSRIRRERHPRHLPQVRAWPDRRLPRRDRARAPARDRRDRRGLAPTRRVRARHEPRPRPGA